MENTTMFGGSLWIWVIFIGFTVISWLISHQPVSYTHIPGFILSDRVPEHEHLRLTLLLNRRLVLI